MLSFIRCFGHNWNDFRHIRLLLPGSRAMHVQTSPQAGVHECGPCETHMHACMGTSTVTLLRLCVHA